MRLLHVIGRFRVGGGAQSMLRKIFLSDQIPHNQHVVSIFSFGKLDREFEQCPSRKSDFHPSFKGILGIFRFVRNIRFVRPDVTICWMYWACFLTLFAPGRGRTIWNIRHSIEDISHESRLNRALIWILARVSNRQAAIIYCSQRSYEQHKALGFRNNHSVCIPNGFETARFKADLSMRTFTRAKNDLTENHFVIGNFVRYHPMKNQDGLLTAFAQMRRTRPDAILMMAGRDVSWENHDLATRIAGLGLKDHVRLLGMRDDMQNLYPALDLYVSASLWGEGFPNVLGEAMACEVPCVATDVGDSAEIVKDAGCFVAAGDQEALINAIGAFYDMSPTERQKLGKAARQKVLEHYDINAVARSYNALIEEVWKS